MNVRILGIETSCDETACGIVELKTSANAQAPLCHLLSNEVYSSMDLHQVYGGVVPEIAARSHIESMIPVIEQSLGTAQCSWDDIDGIAVTHGAGLGGSLLVGVMTARTLALTKQKPLYAVNHVEAHIYANFLTKIGGSSQLTTDSYQLAPEQPTFPMLGLIVSGGHSQLVLWRGHFDYTLLGQTRDDAIGEAFDKVAKIIGLPYPGGPSISQSAEAGDPKRYQLPQAKLDSEYEFSFSGLKTAVLRLAQQEIGESFTFPSHQVAERLSKQQVADIAASFQYTAVATVVKAAQAAVKAFQPRSVVIGGGVAANRELRRQLQSALPFPVYYQDSQLMTDNGAMVATLGCFQAHLQQPPVNPHTLDIQPNLSM